MSEQRFDELCRQVAELSRQVKDLTQHLMSRPDEAARWITKAEARRLTRLSLRSIDYAIKARKWTVTRQGRRVLILKASIDKDLKSHTVRAV